MLQYDIKSILIAVLPILLMAIGACLIMIVMRLAAPKKGVIEARLQKTRENKVSYIKAVEKEGVIERLEHKLAAADVGMSVPVYLGIILVAAVLIYLLTAYLTDAKGIGVILGCAGIFVPPYIVDVLKDRKEDEFDSMFMKALKRMSGSLRAESSLEQALEEVSETSSLPESVRKEFRTCLSDYKYHNDMKKAFLGMYDRTGDKDVKSVALAVAISEKYGSSLADIFDSYADTISKRKIMEANAKAELSSTRTDTMIACAAPFLFGIGMKVMQHDYFDPVYEWLDGMGKYVIIGLYGIVVFGFMFLMKRCRVRLSE